MKTTTKHYIGLLALGLAVFAAPAVKAGTFSFHIDLNVSALLSASSGAPFDLDFQLNRGDSTIGNTVTISNFSFDNGAASGSATVAGGVTGDMNSSIVLNDSDSANGFNEIYQDFSGTTTGIHFDVVTSQSSTGTTQDAFSVQLYDTNGNVVATNAADGMSLVLLPIAFSGSSNSLSDVSTFSSTSPSGVTASAIPEPSTTAALFGGAAVMLVGLRRFTQKRKVA